MSKKFETKLILDIGKKLNDELNIVAEKQGSRSKASLVRNVLQKYIEEKRVE